MNTISTSCCSGLILIITLLQARQILCNDHQNPADTNDLITKTCEKTRYKDLCIASLRSNNESKSADLQGLAKISLRNALDNAAATYQDISMLLNKTGESFVKQCLKDCSENFQNAIEKIEESIAAIDSKRYNDVNIWVSAVMSSEQSCEDGFEEKPGNKSPLTKRHASFTHLCSISLTITNLLAGIGF